MRVIPVLDLEGGRAVHARGGRRDAYAPVRSCLTPAVGDAAALARVYVHGLGASDVYVADLDAIAGGEARADIPRAIAALGARPWVDAGVASAESARAAIAAGAARVIVGLETLPSFDVLALVARELGEERVVFSLDLRAGVPIVRAGAARDLGGTPLALLGRAVAAGARTIIVLDLARVGASGGVELALIQAIRRALPEVELVAGGGVRDREDLARLADAGCDAALVATALHEGRLTRADLEAARDRGTGRGPLP